MLGLNKVKYVAGWDLNIENEEDLEAFLLTHGVTKKGFDFFKTVQSALEVKMKSNTATKIFQHDLRGKELIAEEVTLPIATWIDHKVFVLKKNKKGNHRIGGKRPSELVLPVSDDAKLPFQYIGTLDGTDEYFKWMGLPQMHITFPIFDCNFGIYLDYSDPQKPKFVSGRIDSAWYDEEMNTDAQIEFTPTYFSVSEQIRVAKYEEIEDFILCGVPLWYQYPEIPRCPVTNNVMKFVCTINSDSDIEVVNKEDSKGLPFSEEYLCFGDEGHLYIFFEPESKIAHLNWQW